MRFNINNIEVANNKTKYTGLRDNTKNSMYFPNSNNMTMRGMKTPVKYYGVTNGVITDEGVAYPGQDFKVRGKDTVEFRMPMRRYQSGGRYIVGDQDVTELVNRYNTQGWEGLSEQERDFYMNNYDRIRTFDDSGMEVRHMPEATITANRGKWHSKYGDIPYYDASKSPYSQQNMGKVASEILSQPLQLMNVPGAMSGELVHSARTGQLPNFRNALPSSLNPESSFYGGTDGQKSVSNELGIENPVGSFLVDAVTDPGFVLGAMKPIRFMRPNLYSQEEINLFRRTQEETERLWKIHNQHVHDAKPDDLIDNPSQVKPISDEELNHFIANYQEDIETPYVRTYYPRQPYEELHEIRANDLNSKSGVAPMDHDEYVKRFNDNISNLNDIIDINNKSRYGVRVNRLSPEGTLEIETPVKDRYFNVRIKPGDVSEVLDVDNSMYYENLPGLNMFNTSQGLPARGINFYESLNEYLKHNNLGRVKPGFNSQTESSFNLWNNAIKKGKAHGFIDPSSYTGSVIHGAMKAAVPVVGAGVAAYGANREQKQLGGRYNTFKSSLPSNLANTPENEYAMRRYWNSNQRPATFQDAQNMNNSMFTLEEDNMYHAPSVDSRTGKFLKPKTHPTVNYELDWYNSNDASAVEFRNNNRLVNNPLSRYYKYKSR